MSRLTKVLAAASTVAACCWALPAHALASSTQVSMLMDDDQLIYVPEKHMEQTLQRIASLGVDVVKVSVVWQLIAPDPYSTRRPNFNASDPSAYPSGVWDRYDQIVEYAKELGLKVYFLLIGPAPVWAVAHDVPSHQGPPLGNAPNTVDYRHFVEAVGRRYSGTYVEDPPAQPADPSSPIPTTVGGVPVPGQTQTQTAPSSSPSPAAIPRVSYWGVWNEPNERSWLNPTHIGGAHIQPELYRGLVDAAWNGLSATGHAGDTIMIGETANRGILAPIPFVQSLYCVGPRNRPLTGRVASSIGCPTSGTPADFAAAHPGLFQSAGFSHHPYSFDVAPDRPYPNRSFVTLYNLGWLERTLNAIFATYGVHRPGGVPIYLTEWGYKTDPPNPYSHTSEAEQAAWLDEGDYMTWSDPYVNSLTQFLLVDSPPKQGERRGSASYWSTFQTGLETQNGVPKPALAAFRIPIWLPVARHGSRVTVWGQLRPANHSGSQDGAIEFLAKGSSRWTEVAAVQTANPEGFLLSHVPIPSAGEVRLAWLSPSGNVVYSRTVAVS
jgi:hypothetical protein